MSNSIQPIHIRTPQRGGAGLPGRAGETAGGGAGVGAGVAEGRHLPRRSPAVSCQPVGERVNSIGKANSPTLGPFAPG